jgi:hypothetical protein
LQKTQFRLTSLSCHDLTGISLPAARKKANIRISKCPPSCAHLARQIFSVRTSSQTLKVMNCCACFMATPSLQEFERMRSMSELLTLAFAEAAKDPAKYALAVYDMGDERWVCFQDLSRKELAADQPGWDTFGITEADYIEDASDYRRGVACFGAAFQASSPK